MARRTAVSPIEVIIDGTLTRKRPELEHLQSLVAKTDADFITEGRVSSRLRDENKRAIHGALKSYNATEGTEPLEVQALNRGATEVDAIALAHAASQHMRVRQSDTRASDQEVVYHGIDLTDEERKAAILADIELTGQDVAWWQQDADFITILRKGDKDYEHIVTVYPSRRVGNIHAEVKLPRSGHTSSNITANLQNGLAVTVNGGKSFEWATIGKDPKEELVVPILGWANQTSALAGSSDNHKRWIKHISAEGVLGTDVSDHHRLAARIALVHAYGPEHPILASVVWPWADTIYREGVVDKLADSTIQAFLPPGHTIRIDQDGRWVNGAVSMPMQNLVRSLSIDGLKSVLRAADADTYVLRGSVEEKLKRMKSQRDSIDSIARAITATQFLDQFFEIIT